jgi:hypothetical protein
MTKTQILFVEGTDDQHVIWALLKHNEVPAAFSVEQKGGVEKLLAVLPVQLKGSGVKAVGVVIDADTNLSARWGSIQAILQAMGYHSVPPAPAEAGTILSEADLPKFGVWLMPDNVLTGMLEDFVAKLVPSGDAGFAHAQTVLTSLPAGVQKFAPVHFAKAHIHTWLAWQSDPGTPMGLALTKKYLDAGSPDAAAFLRWLKDLFL